jgi:HSP20 family protein
MGSAARSGCAGSGKEVNMALSDWTFTPGLNFEREFDRLRRQMDDVFGRIGIGAGSGYPAMNIYDNGDHVLVAMQAPGVMKGDLKVELRESILSVTGSLKTPELPDAMLLRDECDYGEFKRTVRIPIKVQQEKIEAGLKSGILTIKMPKSDESHSKSIAINA